MKKLDWFIVVSGIIILMVFAWHLYHQGMVMIPAESCIITTTEYYEDKKQEHLYYCTWSNME